MRRSGVARGSPAWAIRATERSERGRGKGSKGLQGSRHAAQLARHGYLDAARLPRISLHGCRFATNPITKGKQPNEVAALLGHANPKDRPRALHPLVPDKPSRTTMEELATVSLPARGLFS